MTALLTRTIRQAAFTAAVVISCASYASASELPGGHSCNELRSKVTEYGTKLVISVAKSHGYTDKAISRYRTKCRV